MYLHNFCRTICTSRDEGSSDLSESDEETLRCPICESRLSLNDVGTPENCEHNFCVHCIYEWSLQSNTCPLDRSVFHLIFVRREPGGAIHDKLVVGDAVPTFEPDEDIDQETYCQVCGRCDDEATLLLCDECDSGYHLRCLNPPLSVVPENDWYCSACRPDHNSSLPSTSGASVRGGHNVHIPRTLNNQRIFRRVARILSSSESSSESGGEEDAPNGDDGLTSSSEDVGAIPLPPEKSEMAKSTPRRAPVKRKVRASKRKPSTRKTKGKYAKTKGKKKRKSFKRSRLYTRSSSRKGSSTKQRLAGKLGIVGPRPGSSLPLLSRGGKLGAEAEDLQLSVFGDNEGARLTSMKAESAPLMVECKTLIVIWESPTEEDACVVPRPPQKIVFNINSNKKPSIPSITRGHLSQSTDLLGDILTGQSLLASSTKDIEITREGRLKLRPSSSPVRSRLGSGSTGSSGSTHNKPTDKSSTVRSTSTVTPAAHSISSVTSTGTNGSTSGRSETRKLPPIVVIDDGNASGSCRGGTRDSSATKTSPLSSIQKTDIPLPAAPSKEGYSSSSAKSSLLDAERCAAPGGSGAAKLAFGSVLKELDLMAVAPEITTLTVCPAAAACVKKEGRKLYNSGNRESIIETFKSEFGIGDLAELLNGEVDDDEDVLVLTPPPRSPESVVVLSTDSEDERINKTKPKRIKKMEKTDTPVYEINDSDSDEGRYKSRSRSRKRISRSSSGRRSRSRHRTRSRSRHRSRSRSKRRAGSRLRHRRFRSPVGRRRRTPIKERLGQKVSKRRNLRSPLRRFSNRMRTRSPVLSRVRARSPVPHRLRTRSPNAQRNWDDRLADSRSKSPKMKKSVSPIRRNGKTRSPAKRRRRPARSRSNSRDNVKRRRSHTPVGNNSRRLSVSTSPAKGISTERARHRLSRDTRRSSREHRHASRELSIDTSTITPTTHTLAAELERNYKRVAEGVASELAAAEATSDKEADYTAAETVRSKKKSRSENRKKKKQKKSKGGDSEGGGGSGSRSKKKKRHSARKSESGEPMRSPSPSHGREKSKSANRCSRTEERWSKTQKDTEDRRSRTPTDPDSSNSRPHSADTGGSEAASRNSKLDSLPEESSRRSAVHSPSSHSTKSVANRRNGSVSVRTATLEDPEQGETEREESEKEEGSPKEMVIDMSSNDDFSPQPSQPNSPVALLSNSVSPIDPSTGTLTYNSAQESSAVFKEHLETREEPVKKKAKIEGGSSASPYSPSRALSLSDGGEDHLDPDFIENKALQVIALLKNEAAAPDVGPPAQPPRSVAQNPMVVDWLVQRLGESANPSPYRDTPPRRDVTSPVATTGQPAQESYLPASATELSNKQLIAKLAIQERIADDVKNILKPYYRAKSIDKDEYKLIMKNCVNKIYHKSQGKIDYEKVKEFVEKYINSVIEKRTRKLR